MIDDTLDLDEADSELEDEADEEVDKVLYELTDGKLGMAGTVKDSLPVSLPCSSFHYVVGSRLKAD
jgi:charged multivesicular body protein 3